MKSGKEIGVMETSMSPSAKVFTSRAGGRLTGA
jgi:hypothetical protein